jgi:hypothetical protein
MIFVGQASLRHAIDEYMVHYHEERNHQVLGNRLIRPVAPRGGNAALIQRCSRLGGMLNYYYRAAA